MNGLYPNYIAHGRLPRQIVNRALLSVKDETNLDQLLHASPIAYGCSINAGFYHQPHHLLNYEIGPNLNVEKENYISKCWIINNEDHLEKQDDHVNVVNYLIHYNHYERLDDVIIQQKALQSTYSRWQRGQELGEICTINDAMMLLGDTHNESFPIFRVPSQTDMNSVTLCTAHMNFLTLELLIYQHNPKENHPPALIYNLADLFLH